MSQLIAGGCLCGSTRYEITGTLSELGDCHCCDCRRAAGAAYVTWGTAPRAAVRMAAGQGRRIAHANRIRVFAACCGTPLFFEEAADAPTVDIAIATLDDPEPFAPQKIIWLEDRLPWVPLNPALRHFQQSSSK